jgi:hypothetical protein
MSLVVRNFSDHNLELYDAQNNNRQNFAEEQVPAAATWDAIIADRLHLNRDTVHQGVVTIRNHAVVQVLGLAMTQAMDYCALRGTMEPGLFAGIVSAVGMQLPFLPIIGRVAGAATDRLALGVSAETVMRVTASLPELRFSQAEGIFSNIKKIISIALDTVGFYLAAKAFHQDSILEECEGDRPQLLALVGFAALSTSLNEPLHLAARQCGNVWRQRVGSPMVLGASALAGKVIFKVVGELGVHSREAVMGIIAGRCLLELAAIICLQGNALGSKTIVAFAAVAAAIAYSGILPEELLAAMTVAGLCFKLLAAFNAGIGVNEA